MADFVPNENFKRLYENLAKKDGFNVPFEQFEKDMQNEDNFRRLHENLSKKDGFNVPYDQFEKDMGISFTQPVPPAATPNRPANQANDVQPSQPQERERGFWNTWLGDAAEKFGEGAAWAGEGITKLVNLPAKIYANTVADKEGMTPEEKYAFSKLMAASVPNTLNTEATSDALKGIQKNLAGKSDRYQGKDFSQLWKEGDKTGAIGQIMLETTRSLPISLAAGLTGGAGLGLIGGISAAQTYDDLSDPSKPSETASSKEWEDYKSRMNMGELAKVSNAILSGASEAGSEFLGSVPIVRWLGRVYQKVGKKGLNDAVKNGVKTTVERLFDKYGLLAAPVTEGIEEYANQVAQNMVDYVTGARTDLKPLENAGKAFIYGAGGGAQFSAAALPGVIANRVTGNNQGPEEHQNIVADNLPQFTPDPSQPKNAIIETMKAELQNIAHEQGPVVTVMDDQGKTYFVKKGDLDKKKNPSGMLQVVDQLGKPAANNGFLHVNKVRSYGIMDIGDIIEQRLPLIDQMLMNEKLPAVGTEVSYNNSPYIISRDLGDTFLLSDPNNEKEEEVVPKTEFLPKEEPQAQEQPPAPKPMVPVTFGKQSYDFTQNEDGSFTFVPTEKMTLDKALPILEKEFQNKPNWKVVPEKEQIEVPPATPFDEPTLQTVVKSIQIKPKTQQNAAPAPGGDTNMSGNKVNPEIQAQVEADTKPSYQFNGKDVSKDYVQGIIEDADSKEDLAGLTYRNDPGIDAMIEKKFPAPKTIYRIGKKEVSKDRAQARIDQAKTAEKLQELHVENDPEMQQAYDEKATEFQKQADQAQAELNKKHDKLVEMMQSYNQSTPAERKRVNTAPMMQLASELGYNVKYENGSGVKIFKNGTEIRKNADRLTNDEIQSHRSLAEYDEPVQKLAGSLMIPMNIEGIEIGTMQPKEINQAILDTQAGKKTVLSNQLLDEIEKIHNSGVIRLKGDRKTGYPGMEMPLDDFVSLINNDMTEADNQAASLIPEDVARNIEDGQLSPEILDQFGNLIFEGYENPGQQTNKPGGQPAQPGTSEGIPETQKPAQSENTERKVPEKVTGTLSKNNPEEIKRNVASEEQGKNKPVSLEQSLAKADERRKIKDEERRVNTSPTDAQKEAGNYQKGHVKIQGFDISIENPKGSVRKGVDQNGRAWEHTMQNAYGYFRRTEGHDGDQIDVFLGNNPASEKVFVVDQNKPGTDEFDESKTLLGFDSAEQAKAAYMSNYEPGWTGFRAITEVPVEQFREWLYDGAKQRKPFSEYKDTPDPVKEPWQMTAKEFSESFGGLDYADFAETGGLSENQIASYDELVGRSAKEMIEDVDRTRKMPNGSDIHRGIVRNALRKGKPVPIEVLKDYPGLQKQVSQSNINQNAEEVRSNERSIPEGRTPEEGGRNKSGQDLQRKEEAGTEAGNQGNEIETKPSKTTAYVETTQEGLRKEVQNYEVDEKRQSYKTKEGEVIQYTLQFGDANRTSTRNVQRENSPRETPSLRKLKPGEFSLVENKYTADKNFIFDGRNKIESPDDVAYLFRQLENKAVENMFAALIDEKGKPIIVHLSMGGRAFTPIDFGVLSDAVYRFNPKKIYLIHNHPSGNLQYSEPDMKIHTQAREAFGKDLVGEHIIIDTTSGEYASFTTRDDYDVKNRPKDVANPVNYRVIKFDKQVFAEKTALPVQITSSDAVVKFVSAQRFSTGDKQSVLLLNRSNKIMAYLHIGSTDFTSKESVDNLIKELQAYAGRFGASGMILSTNMPNLNGYSPEIGEFRQGILRIKTKLENTRVSLLDVVSVKSDLTHTSFADEGMMEPGREYSKNESVENAQEGAPFYKILGEKGAANLDKAQEATTRLDNLDIAREMEKQGKSPKEIKLATGWEHGADKMWKYEVPDIKLKKSFDELFNSIGKDLTLNDAVDDPELFKAYPELSKTKLHLYENTKRGLFAGNDQQIGGYDDEKGVIRIRLDRKDSRREGPYGSVSRSGRIRNSMPVLINDGASFKSVLSHEIQHYIQLNEGFAVGGNSSKIWDSLISDKLREFEKTGEFSHVDEATKRGIAEGYVRKRYRDPNRAYRSIAGEVEARNVQGRINLTSEERLNTLLSETEDIRPEDQVFIRDGSGISELRQAADKAKESKSAIEKLDYRTNKPGRTVFVNSIEELPAEVRKDPNFQPDKFVATTVNGKTYIDLNRVGSKDEAIAVWVHENGIHGGLSNLLSPLNRQVFGERMYDSFQSIAKTNPEFKSIVDSVLRDYQGQSKPVQGEEMAAFLAEKIVNEETLTAPEKTAWQKVVDYFRNLVRKLFKFDSNLLSEREIGEIIKGVVKSNFEKPTENSTFTQENLSDEHQGQQILSANESQGRKRDEGRSRNAEVARRLGIYRQADRRELQSTWADKPEQEKALKAYAEQEGIWLNERQIAENAARRIPSGAEADVYLDKDGKNVTKIINYAQYSDTPEEFFTNRIQAFNDLFPGTAYSIIGFTETNKGFSFVVSQPFIRGKELQKLTISPETLDEQQERVAKFMEEGFGMEPAGLDAFENDTYLVQDLHLNNVIEGEDGNLYVIDAITSKKNPDIRYRNSGIKKPSLHSILFTPAGKRWLEEKKKERNWKQTLKGFREYIQEKDMPIRRWQDEMVKMGAKIKDNADPFRDKKLAPGRLQSLSKEFEKKMEPLLKTVAKIVKTGISVEWIEPYLIAKHTPERNAEVRRQKLEEFKNRSFNLNRWIEKNDPTEIELQEKIAELREKGAYPSEDEIAEMEESLADVDFAGILPLNKDREGNILDKRFENDPDGFANALVKDFEGMVNPELITELWKNVKTATDSILDAQVASKMITEKQANDYRTRYKNYIPLRGWREDAAKYYTYTKGKAGQGSSVKHAEGRKSLAESPMSYIYKLGYKSLAEQIENEVRESLLRFIANNYDPKFKEMYRIKSAYFVKNGFDPDTKEELWTITTDRPSKEQFESGNAVSEFYYDHMKLRTYEHALEHEVVVHTKDGDVVVVFDRRYPDSLPVAQAFNNQNVMFNIAGGDAENASFANTIVQTKLPGLRIKGHKIIPNVSLREFTNGMKAMFTQFNLKFPITNYPRDFGESNIDSYILFGHGIPLKINKQAYQAIDRYLRGTNDHSGLQTEVENFYNNGGTTGYTHELTPQEYEEKIGKEVKRLLKEGKFNLAKKALSDWLTRYNQRFEDSVRFSVYLNARKQGLSVKDSCYRSRNATVDFNIRGKGSPLLGTVWGFFEVAVNSLAKDAGYFTNFGPIARKRAIQVATAFVITGFMEAMLNDWAYGDDDDDNDDNYYNRSRWMRHNYLNIPLPGNTKLYVPIALPQFWRAFKGMGGMIYDYFIGQRGKLGIGEALGGIALNFVDAMFPVPVTGIYQEGEFHPWAPFIPLFVKPFYEIGINQNFAGQKIYREPFTKEQERDIADSSLYRENVNTAFKFFTDMLAKAAGKDNDSRYYINKEGERDHIAGILDLNPSKIEHLVSGYLGGTGDFVSDIITTAGQLANPNEDFDFKNTPFLNAFIRKTPEAKWNIIRDYYNLKGYIEGMDTQEDKYLDQVKEGNKEAKENFKAIKSNAYDQRYYNILRNSEKRISKLSKYVDYMTGEGSDPVIDEMKEAIDQINELKLKYKK